MNCLSAGLYDASGIEREVVDDFAHKRYHDKFDDDLKRRMVSGECWVANGTRHGSAIIFFGEKPEEIGEIGSLSHDHPHAEGDWPRFEGATFILKLPNNVEEPLVVAQGP